MTNTSWVTQNRVPKGSPEAGEWSEGRRSEAEGVSLSGVSTPDLASDTKLAATLGRMMGREVSVDEISDALASGDQFTSWAAENYAASGSDSDRARLADALKDQLEAEPEDLHPRNTPELRTELEKILRRPVDPREVEVAFADTSDGALKARMEWNERLGRTSSAHLAQDVVQFMDLTHDADRIARGRYNMAEHRSPELAAEIDAALASLPSDNARAMFVSPHLDHEDSLDNRRERARTLDAQGYTSADLDQDKLYSRYLRHGVIPRAEVTRAMVKRGMGKVTGSRYLDDALLHADTDKLVAAIGDPSVTQVADLVEVHDPQRAQRMRRGFDLGLTTHEIEQDVPDIETHAAVAEALGRYRVNAANAIEDGHTPATVKQYGGLLASRHPAAVLTQSPTKPAVLKSLTNRDKLGLSITQLDAVAAAGVTKGADLAALEKVIDPRSDGDDVIRMAQAAPVSAQIAYASSLHKGRNNYLTLNEAQKIKRLADAGYDDPSKLHTLTAEGFASESQQLRDIPSSGLDAYLSIIESGATPHEVKVATQSGIHPSQIAELKTSGADPWQMGAARRAEWENAFGRPWPYSRD